MKFESRFRHAIPVRYGEVDQQGVVFNAHYMAYIDDTLESWVKTYDGDARDLGWDMMLKRAVIEWHGSAGENDILDIDGAITKWGRTSWEMTCLGSVNGEPVFTSTILYISVVLGENVPMETPEEIRELFGPAVGMPQ